MQEFEVGQCLSRGGRRALVERLRRADPQIPFVIPNCFIRPVRSFIGQCAARIVDNPQNRLRAGKSASTVGASANVPH